MLAHTSLIFYSIAPCFDYTLACLLFSIPSITTPYTAHYVFRPLPGIQMDKGSLIPTVLTKPHNGS